MTGGDCFLRWQHRNGRSFGSYGAMVSLGGFPRSSPAGVGDMAPVAEVDGRIIFGTPGRPAHPSVERHPSIHVAREISGTRDEGLSVYVRVQDALLKRLTSVWYERGFVDAVQVAAEARDPRDALVSRIAALLLKAINAFDRARSAFRPPSRYTSSELTSQYSRTRDWSGSAVRFIAWHPHAFKVAVVTADDNVRIFGSDPNSVPVLKCSSQKGVSFAAWRPNSASEIAVGCESCIIVWTVDPNSTFTKPSPSNAVILKSSGHRPISSLSWSPDGDLLISASAADCRLNVWNPSGGEPCSVSRLAGGGVAHISWAPDGTRLFAATAGIIFRVWETEKWQAERWSVRGGRVQAACWSPCSKILLFATEEETLIYELKFSNASLFAVDNLPVAAAPVVDLTKVELEDGKIAGGRVLDLQWSPQGHHLAVIFKESPLVAVFNTHISHTLQITPCCYVTGIESEKANVIAFQHNFNEGACLSIGWSSGRVQHFPLIYNIQ